MKVPVNQWLSTWAQASTAPAAHNHTSKPAVQPSSSGRCDCAMPHTRRTRIPLGPELSFRVGVVNHLTMLFPFVFQPTDNDSGAPLRAHPKLRLWHRALSLFTISSYAHKAVPELGEWLRWFRRFEPCRVFTKRRATVPRSREHSKIPASLRLLEERSVTGSRAMRVRRSVRRC
jgi:hypothetical protein